MAIHHVSVGTNNLDRAQAFYDPIMEILGLRRFKRSDRLVGYGLTEIVFSIERPADGSPCRPGNGIHVALHAGHRNVVDDFHRAGIVNGGSDDGAAGVRAAYDKHYYAAFLRDPDGNKIEVVTFSANRTRRAPPMPAHRIIDRCQNKLHIRRRGCGLCRQATKDDRTM